MQKKKYSSLSFNYFPRVWGIITIPEKTIIYRGGTKKPNLGKDPRFFSDFDTARLYMNKVNEQKPGNYNVYACVTKELKLVDLRTLRHLFTEYIGYNDLLFNDDELNKIEIVKFAFGLMTLSEQFVFIKNNHNKFTGLKDWDEKYRTFRNVSNDFNCSLLEDAPEGFDIKRIEKHYMQYGHRISECSIDDIVVAFLKSIFGDTIHGYIAPFISSLWHGFNFPPELCLFDPNNSLKFSGQVPEKYINNPEIKVPEIDISVLLEVIYPKQKIAQRDYIKGGSNGEEFEEGESCPIKTSDEYKNKKKFFENIPKNFTNEKNEENNLVLFDENINIIDFEINKINKNSNSKNSNSKKYPIKSQIISNTSTEYGLSQLL